MSTHFPATPGEIENRRLCCNQNAADRRKDDRAAVPESRWLKVVDDRAFDQVRYTDRYAGVQAVKAPLYTTVRRYAEHDEARIRLEGGLVRAGDLRRGVQATPVRRRRDLQRARLPRERATIRGARLGAIGTEAAETPTSASTAPTVSARIDDVRTNLRPLLEVGLGLAVVAVVAVAASGKSKTSTPPPAGDPPPPADFPTRPGGYKAVAQPTAEMSAVAASVLAQHPAVGTMTEFVADDGKTYGAWVTYHLKGGEWVRAVEIWEKV